MILFYRLIFLKTKCTQAKKFKSNKNCSYIGNHVESAIFGHNVT